MTRIDAGRLVAGSLSVVGAVLLLVAAVGLANSAAALDRFPLVASGPIAGTFCMVLGAGFWWAASLAALCEELDGLRSRFEDSERSGAS